MSSSLFVSADLMHLFVQFFDLCYTTGGWRCRTRFHIKNSIENFEKAQIQTFTYVNRKWSKKKTLKFKKSRHVNIL